jgi:hypothetical protein
MLSVSWNPDWSGLEAEYQSLKGRLSIHNHYHAADSIVRWNGWWGSAAGRSAQLSTSLDPGLSYFNWIGLETGSNGGAVPVQGNAKTPDVHIAYLDKARTVELVTVGFTRGSIQIRNHGGTPVHVIIAKGGLTP